MANEKRLIDANALKEVLKEKHDWIMQDPEVSPSIKWGEAICNHRVCEAIEKSPTVDAVEVVRCKDCVSYEEQCPSFGYCYHWDYEQGMSPNQVDGDDFCSYGERKDNDL